ncbi:MAG TPA: proton-conducting membrane transporter [Lachnospiraceae bacterium]|nr:proton-conducting membrane transporter [Lachnospiraceae bacterium]
MRNAGIIISILLPVVGGIFLFERKQMTERGRRICCELIACLTTVIVWSVIAGGTVDEFTVYSFTRGFAIAFRADGPALLFAGMVSAMWPFVTLYAFEYMENAIHKSSFFGFYIMTYGVTLGVAFSGNLLTMYVFYEMLSLVTLPLVTHEQNHESMYAGRIYATYVIGGAAMAFLPVVVMTMFTEGGFVWGGHLYSDLGLNYVLILWLLGFFGFGVKAAVIPFHIWLPSATIAPTPVTALLHAVAVVNSGVYAVTRLTWYVFSPERLSGTWAQIVALLTACATLLYAAGRALKERHFKRRLAYSTVSNLSYMLFGILLMTPAGLQAGMAHMLFHGIIKMSLFLCAGAFIHKAEKNYIYELNGVGRKMPLTFFFYTLGAMSLSGIPLFAGFVSKWNLLTAGGAAQTAWGYVGDVSLLIASFLCSIYTLTVSVRAFFPGVGTDRWKDTNLSDPGWRMMLPIILFTVVDIAIGVYPGPIMGFLARISGGVI